MRWNFKEELVASSTQALGPDDIPVTTYYQYDSKGKRLRKITENDSYSPGTGLTGPLPAPTPTLKNQRVYIEGYEYYEDFGSGEITHSLSLIDEGRRFVMVEDSTLYDYRVRYQHPNHQSSCTLETDDIGRIITYEEYHPFGTTSYQATNAAITASYKRYRYTGMERDEETGLNYHNARYYIPWLGRWASADPIGIGDGVNVYAYCGGNPVTYNDTEGTQVNKADYTRQDNAKFVPRIELKALMEANKRQSNVKEGVQLAKAFSETYNKNNPGFHEKAQARIAKQQKKSETAIRVEGALQIVSGTIEASVGGAGGVITSETGVGAVAGWAILTHGVDNMVAGYNKLMTGKPSQTQTEQLISAVAQDYTDKGTADKIGAFGNTVISIAGSSGNVVSMVDAAAINSVKPIIATENAVQSAMTSFDDVAAHVSKTGQLPSNFITKAEAQGLGWNPKLGNLDVVAPGKSIGGDVFKNTEGLLPKAPGRTWYEADINYTGGFRGTDRLLYSNDGLLFKTTDHYKTFTQIE